jgi:two-component system, response regulator
VAKVILLIEDNESDELLTIRAFRRSNIVNDIDVVRDGSEALDYIFSQGTHAGRDEKNLPALVLLDLNLPKVDGLEVLRGIRGDARTRLLPVVVLTSSKEDEDIVRSYELGANAYVRKPVDFVQFSEAVQTLGLFWLVLNEAAPVPRKPG